LLIRQHGKPILEYQLSRFFDQPISIKDVSILFPSTIVLRELKVPGAFEARSVLLKVVIPNPLQREWVAASLRLENPRIIFSRREDNVVGWGEAPGKNLEPEPLASSTAGNQKVWWQDWTIRIRHFNAAGADIVFKDEATVFELAKVDMAVHNFTFPLKEGKMGFVLRGKLVAAPEAFSGKICKAHGWVNWPRRDMDAQVKISLESGETVLSANGRAVNNDLRVDGRIRVSSSMAGEKGGRDGESGFSDFLWGTVNLAGVEVDTKFSFSTRLDQPRVGKVKVEGDLGFSQPTGNIIEKLQEKVVPTVVNGL